MLNSISTWIAGNRKFITAIVAGLVIIITALTTGHAIDWTTVAVAVLGSLGVWAVPNQPPAPVAVVSPAAPHV